MVVNPRIGESVRVHYRRSMADAAPWHGRIGTVRITSHGPGPRNVGVEIDGRLVVIPRGNLVRFAPPR